MKIKLIAAVDIDGGIGKDGKMPWPRLKTDLKRFKELTTGHPVIMGRVTAESIGKPLPNRTNIVVSHTMYPQADGFGLVARDVEEAVMIAKKADDKECWIIGGAQIYQLAFDVMHVDEIHLTVIKGNYECDSFFPKLNLFEWACQLGCGYSEIEDVVPYVYKVFRRINPLDPDEC